MARSSKPASNGQPESETDNIIDGLTPAERTLRARQGAYAMLAKHDVMVTSAPGRAAAARKFEDQVDPDRVLSADERARLAAEARRAHMSRMGQASAKARRAKKANR